MKAWEIYSWQPPQWDKPHPVVIVSHPDRADRKNPVELIVCSTQRATRQAEPHEVILDEADGLDWPTLCKCDLIHAVDKKELQNPRGRVTEARRAAIVRTIMEAHDWATVL